MERGNVNHERSWRICPIPRHSSLIQISANLHPAQLRIEGLFHMSVSSEMKFEKSLKKGFTLFLKGNIDSL